MKHVARRLRPLAMLVGLLTVLGCATSAPRAAPGLHASVPPEEGDDPDRTEDAPPGRPSWSYAAASPPRDPRHEPTAMGAFLQRRGRVAIGLEMGWPFYELRIGVGLHHRVQLEAALRGMWAWTVGAYAGLKIGLLQNRQRSTALSLRIIGGYQHLLEDQDQTFRQLGGGNGGYGEVALLGALRRGNGTLLLQGGARLSQVDGCTRWDRDGDGACPVQPFGGNDTGLFVTGFVEVGYASRINAQVSFFVAVGLDLFAQGGRDWPAMVRARTGFAVDFR